MVEALGTFGFQLVAGAGAIAGLGTIAIARASAATPRPCWERRNGCAMRAADAGACRSCAVYMAAHYEELDLHDLPELGEVRSIAAG